VNGWSEDKTPYTVHFVEGGAGRSWFHVPLQTGRVITERGLEYVVLSVEQPKQPDVPAVAWVELA
jgi:hypothetical protein